ERASHEEGAAVHRPRDLLSWASRVRPRPCAPRGQRAVSGRRSRTAPRVPTPRSCDGRSVARAPGVIAEERETPCISQSIFHVAGGLRRADEPEAQSPARLLLPGEQGRGLFQDVAFLAETRLGCQ